MKSRFRPVIRVFVSSAFSDLKEERNILQRDMFPRLEQYCLIRGFQFQAIDLRWGVPGEAGLDHRTMQTNCAGRRRFRQGRISWCCSATAMDGNPCAEVITEAEFLELEKLTRRLGKGVHPAP
jgi:hypothetical protein